MNMWCDPEAVWPLQPHAGTSRVWAYPIGDPPPYRENPVIQTFVSQTFGALRAFAEHHAPTRTLIEACKDEIVAQNPHWPEPVVRMIVEDLLVCGAVCIEGGEVIDVATIHLLLDANGRVPSPPLPAYKQVIPGRDPILLTQAQIRYIRLPADGLYPIGPVEKLMAVRAGLRAALA